MKITKKVAYSCRRCPFIWALFVVKYSISCRKVDFVAYSKLIKSFACIRNEIREFYVYGFKRQEAHGIKSAVSAYDGAES